jgi:hypothetical protein
MKVCQLLQIYGAIWYISPRGIIKHRCIKRVVGIIYRMRVINKVSHAAPAGRVKTNKQTNNLSVIQQ